MPMEASRVCTLTVIGSTPIRSTKQRADSILREDTALAWRPVFLETGRVRFPVGPLTTFRKVAGYGLPGRTANACHQEVMRVQIPCLPPVCIRLDGETDIMSRFEPEVPGSNPGRATWGGASQFRI